MPIAEIRLKALSAKQIERLLDQIDKLKMRHKKEQLKVLRRFIKDISESDLEEEEDKMEHERAEMKKLLKTKEAKGSKKKHGLDISMSSDSEDSESDEDSE